MAKTHKRLFNFNFNNWSLVRQIFFCLFLATFFAVVVLSGILYHTSVNQAIKMNHLLNANNLEVAGENIELILNSAEEAGTNIFFNKDMQNCVLGGEPFENQLELYNKLNTELYKIINSTPSISGIAIFKRDGSSVLVPGEFQSLYVDYVSCRYFFSGKGMGATFEDHMPYWYALNEGQRQAGLETGSFVNIRDLRGLDSRESVASLLIYVDEDTICNLYSFFGSKSLIMTENGQVISSVTKELLNTWVPEDLYKKIVSPEKGLESFTWQDGKILRAGAGIYLPSISAYLVAIPDENPAAGQRQAAMPTVVLLVFFGTFFSLTAAGWLSRIITRRLVHLKKTMETVQAGNLSIRFPEEGGHSEVEYLGRSFNSMLTDINTYISEIRESDAREREGEMKLLQAQINPHLLYNTLDSALWLVKKGENSTAVRVLDALSGFFKISLSKGEFYIPIGTELQHIREYLELQRMCRGKDVKLIINNAEKFHALKIVKMTFQPIVENSFLHAFVGAVSDGTITVDFTSSENEGILWIRFTDNGMGMTDDELAAVRDNLATRKDIGKGFGLWNVDQRLKRYYGSGYGLSVASEFGIYTSVTVAVPLREEK